MGYTPELWARTGARSILTLMMETLLKWMIWGYHYFWKHPNGDCFFRRRFSLAMVSWCTRLGFSVEKAGHETQLLSGTEGLNQICAETKCFLLMFMLVWLAKLCPSLETLKFLKHVLFISKYISIWNKAKECVFFAVYALCDFFSSAKAQWFNVRTLLRGCSFWCFPSWGSSWQSQWASDHGCLVFLHRLDVDLHN